MAQSESLELSWGGVFMIAEFGGFLRFRIPDWLTFVKGLGVFWVKEHLVILSAMAGVLGVFPLDGPFMGDA